MKKILLFIVIIFCNLLVIAQGFVKEKQVIKSVLLNREVHYTIFLPNDYYTSERKYPVTYLLHGYGDQDDGWIQFGEINRLAQKGIDEGTIPPMLIVTPDGFTSFYINAANGKMNYEDFFIKELIPHIEKTYKVKAEKKYRGIAGLSMGGYGSLVLALKYPDLFAATAPLSAAVWTNQDIVNLDANMYNTLFGTSMNQNLVGEARITENWIKNSPFALIEKKSASELAKVNYWIDCGDDDFLTKGNAELHIKLIDKKVPHEFRMRDGAHNWSYWRSGIIEALAFIGNSFHQK